MLSYSSPHSGHVQLTATEMPENAADVQEMVVALVDGVADEVDGREVALAPVPVGGAVPRRGIGGLDHGRQLSCSLVELGGHGRRVLLVVVVVVRGLVGIGR